MTQLKTGDVVRLKSGSPKMTVHTIDGETVTCQWFDRNGKTHKDSFPSDMLDAFVARETPQSD